MLLRIASRVGSAVRRGGSGSLMAIVSLCLAAGLTWVGPLANDVWARGDHVTPEQWGQHAQLVARGYTAHHGVTHSSSSNPDRVSAPAAAAMLAPPQIVGPVAPLAMPTENLLSLAAEGALSVRPAAWTMAFGDSVIPSGLPANPPPKPPPSGA